MSGDNEVGQHSRPTDIKGLQESKGDINVVLCNNSDIYTRKAENQINNK